MSSESPAPRAKRLDLVVGVPPMLMTAVDRVRAAIQEQCQTSGAISRADVVRLALRRLYLEFLAHQIEQSVPGRHDLEAEITVREIQEEGTCPDWLFPGTPEKPTPRPRKKKGE